MAEVAQRKAARSIQHLPKTCRGVCPRERRRCLLPVNPPSNSTADAGPIRCCRCLWCDATFTLTYCPVSRLYCCKSAMLVSTYPCFLQNRFSSGSRAISVGFSSDTISHKSPAGVEPANLAKSTAASVCPSRASTPLSFARNGNMCPGRWKSLAFASCLASRTLVVARSVALIPVVIPFGFVQSRQTNEAGQKQSQLNDAGQNQSLQLANRTYRARSWHRPTR